MHHTTSTGSEAEIIQDQGQALQILDVNPSGDIRNETEHGNWI